jgi:predicted nucleic acid-binding protein
MGFTYKKTKTGIKEKFRVETSKELIADLQNRISIIKKMKVIVGEKMGKVSVSFDTELLIMCDYCDYLVEELEKHIREIKRNGLK